MIILNSCETYDIVVPLSTVMVNSDIQFTTSSAVFLRCATRENLPAVILSPITPCKRKLTVKIILHWRERPGNKTLKHRDNQCVLGLAQLSNRSQMEHLFRIKINFISFIHDEFNCNSRYYIATNGRLCSRNVLRQKMTLVNTMFIETMAPNTRYLRDMTYWWLSARLW